MAFHVGGFADYDLSDMFRLTGRLGIHGMGADLVQDLGTNTQNTLTSSIHHRYRTQKTYSVIWNSVRKCLPQQTKQGESNKVIS